MKGDEFLEGLLKERLEIQNRRKELQNEMIALDATIEHYCKRHNICLECRGTGDVYYPCKDSGDPYHKSSDDRRACSVCGGNGKYKGGK